LPRGSKLWIALAVCLVLAEVTAWAFLRPGLTLTAVSDIVESLILLALLIVFKQNAAQSHGRLRSVWALQGICWSFWLVDQCAWTVWDVILRRPVPEMFPGDVILFLAGVPMLAGLLLRPHLEPSKRSVRLGMLDFFQLMLWWVFFYVYLVMCWQFGSPNSGLYNRNYDRLYLVQIFVLVTVLAQLLRQSSGQWRRFYFVFLGAALFNSLAVVAENRAIEQNIYFNGCWYDLPFMASLAFFIYVAVKGRGLTPAPESNRDRRYRHWMASLAMLAVLSLPVIVVIAVSDNSTPLRVVHFRVVVTAVAMFLMASLVFVKQRRLHEELKRTNQTLERASMTDPLTGIRNRRFFSATIESDVAQALRAYAEGRDRSMRDLVFYLIDMDNFKEINDLYGHDAGDRVLIEATRRIASAARDSDVLLRWGGEEFLIVSRSADRRQADVLALRIMQAVRAEPFAISTSQQVRRTCSIGWAAFPWREESPEAVGYEEVLNLADRALGQAKRAGKDQVIGMTPMRADANPAPAHRRDPDSFLTRALRHAESIDLQLAGPR